MKPPYIAERITKDNPFWPCDQCGTNAKQLIVLGSLPDYDSATAALCFRCLKKAMKLVEKTERNAKSKSKKV